MSKKERELEREIEMVTEQVPKNLGQQKLRVWAAGRSIRQAAKDLGSNYRSYRRWAWEGALPDYDGRRLCRIVAGVDYEDWELPISKALARKLERLDANAQRAE